MRGACRTACRCRRAAQRFEVHATPETITAKRPLNRVTMAQVASEFRNRGHATVDAGGKRLTDADYRAEKMRCRKDKDKE